MLSAPSILRSERCGLLCLGCLAGLTESDPSWCGRSMLHDLRIGKPMELAELWTSFEAISELTGIDMPVRTHISLSSCDCSNTLPSLSPIVRNERSRGLKGTKERRKRRQRKKRWWVAGDEGMRGAGGAAAVDQGQELADRPVLPRRSLRRVGLAALTDWL